MNLNTNIYILSWSGRPHKLPTTDGKLVNKPMPFHGWANHQRFLLFLLKIRIRLSVCGSTSDLVKWHPGHPQGKRGCSRFTIFGSPAALCRASPRLTAVAEQPLSHRGNELQSLLFEPGQLRCRLTNQAMVHAVLALPSLHHSTSRGLKIDMARLLRPSKTPLINAGHSRPAALSSVCTGAEAIEIAFCTPGTVEFGVDGRVRFATENRSTNIFWWQRTDANSDAKHLTLPHYMWARNLNESKNIIKQYIKH